MADRVPPSERAKKQGASCSATAAIQLLSASRSGPKRSSAWVMIPQFSADSSEPDAARGVIFWNGAAGHQVDRLESLRPRYRDQPPRGADATSGSVAVFAVDENRDSGARWPGSRV